MTFFPFAPAPPREAAPPAVVGPGDSALTVTLPHQLCEAGEGPGVGQTQWVTVLQPEALTPSFLHRGRSPTCGLPALASLPWPVPWPRCWTAELPLHAEPAGWPQLQSSPGVPRVPTRPRAWGCGAGCSDEHGGAAQPGPAPRPLGSSPAGQVGGLNEPAPAPTTSVPCGVTGGISHRQAQDAQRCRWPGLACGQHRGQLLPVLVGAASNGPAQPADPARSLGSAQTQPG